MPFQLVETQRLYERVAIQISSLLTAGEFGVGERLPPERELAKRLGVSRPVIREAMVALELSGLVEVRTGSGSFVISTTPTRSGFAGNAPHSHGPSPFELLAARRLIESEIAAEAARQAEPEHMAQLDSSLEALRVSFAAGGDGLEADRDFHIALARATGNAVIERVVMALWDDMNGPILSRLHGLTAGWSKDRTTYQDHLAIRDAIVARNPAAACAAMSAHIAHVEAFFIDESPTTENALSDTPPRSDAPKRRDSLKPTEEAL